MQYDTLYPKFILIIQFQSIMTNSKSPANEILSRGICLHQQGKPEEALACYLQVLDQDPAIDIYLNIGAALHDLGQFADALAAYQRALERDPASGKVYHNRGNTLLELDRYEEAIASYARAVQFMPDNVEALVTMGTAMEKLGNYTEAFDCYEVALARNPECAEAHWNLALLMLLQGRFEEGWREFEWRWRKKGYTSLSRSFDTPPWTGEPLNSKTILIHAEQAFGDTIQFARYLPMVADRGGKVILECPAQLARLLETVEGVCQVVPAGSSLPRFNYHAPLMSLPLIFGTTPGTIPTNVPYLSAPAECTIHWQGLLENDPHIKIGIVWAGRRKPDPHRSCQLKELAPLAAIKEATFYTLQIGEGAEQAASPPPGMELVDLTGQITDFADTAALIVQLDMVVSIDTAVAHLAGALGKPTFLLLPFAPDWRWMLDRKDSPWYPTMRIFRQDRRNSWREAVGLLKEELINGFATRYQQPTNPSTTAEQYRLLAMECYERGNMEQAELLFRKALGCLPSGELTVSCLSLLLNEQGRFEESIVLLRQAIDNHQGNTSFHRYIGDAYQGAGQLAEARIHYLQALRQHPQDPVVLMNLGIICDTLNYPDDALNFSREAAKLAPDDPRIWLNLGGVFQTANLLLEATSCYRKALRLDPSYATAAWNLSLVLLLQGEYTEGFRLFESRFFKQDAVPDAKLYIPNWAGENLSGRTIVVWTEQAFGDAIQFARYVPLLAKQGAHVVILNHLKPLDTLLASLPGADSMVSDPRSLPHGDYQVPLLSLPRLCSTTLANIPARVPYLTPSKHKVHEWQAKMPTANDFTIGITWAGRPLPDPRRTAHLSAFAPLGKLIGVTFYSLQVGVGAEEATSPPGGMRLIDLTAAIRDFEDTAALIANLDLVISVDTSVAHLAGAMGKPVWTLLPFSPDWRWLSNRDDSPWYPTMRLFRQPKPGEWAPVVEQVSDQLQQALELSRRDV